MNAESDAKIMQSTQSGYGLLVVDGWTVDAGSGVGFDSGKWFCRMAGYQSYNSYTTYSYSWQQSFPTRYMYLQCYGSVVPQCVYLKRGRSYNYAL